MRASQKPARPRLPLKPYLHPMTTLYDRLTEVTDFLHSRTSLQPRYGIILGTGLNGLADDIDVETIVPYGEIPHFPESTVQSHRGQLIFGHLQGVPVVAMAGRFHYYEGYSMGEVTFPVRVLCRLGIGRLIISNVAGGTNADFQPGDLILLKDHINLQPANPLRGPNDERLGPRFPDMLKTYDRALNQRAVDWCTARGYRAAEGVYVALPGPNLETPAEYRFLHLIGGDLVGMSTVPEVIAARHMDMPVTVISVVSNQCYPVESISETTVEEVIAVAQEAEPKLRALVGWLVAQS